MVRSIYHKLDWRLRFLLGGTPSKARELLGANPFSLSERLAYVNPIRGPLNRERMILRALRRCGGQNDYFRINGLRIYFRPEFPVEDEEELLAGVVLILKEAYLAPDHFSDDVRIQPGDCVIDLGGNLGTSAISFSRAAGPGGRVFSFEPLTASLIERNLRANGISNVTVVPCAAGERSGEAEFTCGAGLLDSSMVRPPSNAIRTIKVPVVSLDDYVEQQDLDRVDFIKMDIEGAEEQALLGARNVIERFRPRWSIASYHTDHEGDRQHPKLVRLLREFGYRVEEVEQKRIFARWALLVPWLTSWPLEFLAI